MKPLTHLPKTKKQVIKKSLQEMLWFLDNFDLDEVHQEEITKKSQDLCETLIKAIEV